MPHRAHGDGVHDKKTVVIENVAPLIDGGRYPVKRSPGDTVDVWATLVRDGHEVLGVAVHLREARGQLFQHR